MKPQITKLKNRYTGEIVFCRDIKKVIQDKTIPLLKFLRKDYQEEFTWSTWMLMRF